MNTKKVMLEMAIVAVLLIAAVGSASAVTVINSCDFHADTAGDYVLGQNLNCDPGVTAIWVEANSVTIDGYNATDDTYYKISGDRSGGLTYGVFANVQDDVTIKNLEVEHFGMGIRIKASWDGSMKTCLSWSNRPTIDNCTVHDCGEGTLATHGIQFVCAPDGSITNCEVYNSTGNVAGSCADGGNGIQLFGKSSNTIVDNNVIYNNTLAGIYSKANCQNCNITNNDVFENGKVLPVGLACFGGGIRFQCKSSANELIENNTVTDNFGPGIFMGGNDCILRNNTVTGSKDANNGVNARGDGFRNDRHTDGGGKRTKLYDNTFCDNEHLDINVESAAQNVTGDDNTCDTIYGYDDEGTTGCTYSCPGVQTYTITGTVPGVDMVNITNLNTSVEYVAEVVGNDYTLTLDVPGEVEAGNELLIVACDVPSEHESNCNVTTHAVETAPGEETVDLTLNHYCLNYYPDYPYYTQEEDNWSGPAVMKACIAHYIAPPTQTVLNDTGIANNHGNHAGLLYVDPRGMETTMDSYLHPYNHNYGTFAIPAVEDALHRICYWQKLGPGAVPAYGDYSNWMAVRGIHTSKKPTDYSAPYDYEVYGFWVNDPNPSGIGENSYKTATEFTTDYYIPTIDLQVPAWNEKYMSVLEPPVYDAEITIVAAKPRLADAITPELMAKPMMLYGTKQLALENVVRDDELLRIVQAATDGVTEELVPYDSEFAAVFTKTMPGKPMFVSSDNGDYYVVPFNVPVKERSPVKILPIEIEKPNGFKKLGRGKRRADKIDFKPVPIELIRAEKTLVVVIVDAEDGSFKEASWVADPEKYLPVSKIEAMKLALGEVLDELHMVARKDARDLGVLKQKPTIELVHRDASPYYPDWKVTVDGKVIYVSQDGTVSCDEPEEPKPKPTLMSRPIKPGPIRILPI